MAANPRIEELKRRVQRDPASIAFAALADEYRRAGLFHDAIETCRAGLQRHPAYLSARVTLGRALLEIGEYPEATEHLEQVLRAAPENLAAIRALAEIHRRRGDGLETLEHRPDPEAQPTAARVPLKLVPFPSASAGSEAAPATAAVRAAVPTPSPAPEPVVQARPRGPSPQQLLLEDLELFLGGIDRARQLM
jgi:tetratricopeptide (TPR) repeat protein